MRRNKKYKLKKKEIMNKKQKYQKPFAETIHIATVDMIATSNIPVGYTDDKVDNNASALSSERRGGFGDLWDGN